jgi:hypothetical protein
MIIWLITKYLEEAYQKRLAENPAAEREARRGPKRSIWQKMGLQRG